MAKTKHKVAALPVIDRRDLQKERREKIGRTVALLPVTDRLKELLRRYRREQLTGRITNAWMGAGVWWFEVEVQEVPPQGSGYTGHTLLQLKESEVRTKHDQDSIAHRRAIPA